MFFENSNYSEVKANVDRKDKLLMSMNRKQRHEYLKQDNRPLAVDIYCLVYNHGKYLRKALDGMLMQKTDFPVRIVIHDDASTDDSTNIILEYKERYPDKIIAIIEETNLYQNGKSIWTKMMPYLTAKYIATCEGDDYWTDPNKLQKQIDYLENHPDYAACYHNILPVDANGQYREELRGMYSQLEEGDYTEEEIRHFILKTQTASLVRRNYNLWLTDEDKKMYLSTKCNGDEKHLIICSSYGKIHILPDAMAAHRRVLSEGTSWTASQNKKNEQERFIASQKGYIALCRFYEHFHGVTIYPYNYILNERLKYYIKKKKSNSLSTCEDRKNIKEIVKVPFYAYLIFIPVFIWQHIKHVV